MSYNLLKGKRGIIFGALNDQSIAWKVAERAVEEGATITLSSNPQPIGFRGNLLVKRQKFFYCTYSLGITETS